MAAAIAAPLLLGSCASKKAVADGTATSSTSSKHNAKTEAADDNTVTTMAFLQKVNDNQVYANDIVGNISFNLTAGSKDITVPGALRMRKDKVIRLQLFIPILGTEVGRLEFTPDYVLVIDRLHKEYVKADYSQVDFLRQNGITFYSLQSLFWNQLFVPGEKKVVITISADNKAQLLKLDEAIEQVEKLQTKKMMKIDMLRNSLRRSANDNERMSLCYDIFNEFHVLQFDSALHYIDKVQEMAIRTGNRHIREMAIVDKAELLGMGGFYPEAIELLDKEPLDSTDNKVMFKSYIAHFRIYLYWADYCNDAVFAPIYRERASKNLETAMRFIGASPATEYYRGEYYIYVKHDNRNALECYFRVLRSTPHDAREYAMAACAVAHNYSAKGDMEHYEYYLIEAAHSDLLNCTRENMALQDLAMFLYQQGEDNMERAERYINLAMEDAKLFNNRLRIIEISQKLPVIVGAYKQLMKRRNTMLRISTFGVSALAIILIVFVYFFMKQNRQLSTKRRELSEKNSELTSLNDRLHTLNDRLLDTNRRREHLAKLYIDLCANFIDRLAKFELLVKRKIKANQIKELLSMASSSKMSDEDAASFLHRFDKAFLDLYPTFVDEFTELLLPDAKILPRKGVSLLTTELRIFALVRLGVTESSEISALLFYTPRTIYNYRSSVKSKAINRDTFEQDVMKLCTVI